MALTAPPNTLNIIYKYLKVKFFPPIHTVTLVKLPLFLKLMQQKFTIICLKFIG